MALNMRIEVSSGVAATDVPEQRAADLQEAYEALAKLPVNRMVTVDFPEDGETDYAGPKTIDGHPATDADKAAWYARRFVKQGKAWAAAQTVKVDVTDEEGNVTGQRDAQLTFARKGDIKGNPTRVSFRIYPLRDKSEDGETETQEATE